MLAADIDAQGCLEGIVVVEQVGQGLEHGFPLTNRESNGQHFLARLGEQLPHDDARVACTAGCIWPTDNQFDGQGGAACRLGSRSEGTKHERDVCGRHAFGAEFRKAFRERRV